MKTRCDIIVPVYNALEDLKACVDSVFANTAGTYRLVLIDDKSTEVGVSEYLAWLESHGPAVVVVKRNETNVGFVRTVNRGMKESPSDVVLLNSDTVVTRGWLEKLAQCAYSDESIASVTPLTNNGTICSIPNFCEDNPLPDGFTPQTMADLVEQVSMRLYPEIPTAVGFCMYIKREAIEKTGYFDDDTFGRGYGEENDWCCRAAGQGFVHVLDDATFIYHKGAMSFRGDKAALIEKNLKLLFKKHPHYFEMVDRFVAENPLSAIQENINLHLSLASGPSPRVLVASSSRDELGSVCGLAEGLKSKAIYYAFWLDGGRRLVLHNLVSDGGDEMQFELNTPVLLPSVFHLEYRKLLVKVFNTFRIDALLLHGPDEYHREILNAAKISGVKTIGPDKLSTLSSLDPADHAPDVKAPFLGWNELKAAMRNAGTSLPEPIGYTRKQREAFDFLLSLANRNQKPLKMAKFLYYLLTGKTRK